MKSALIISDGKPGHVNQSTAFCRHLGLEYDLIEVAYRSRLCKALSYLLDRLGIYTKRLYSEFRFQSSGFDLIVSTGSTTCYANKLVAKKTGRPNVAILYPKGCRLDFTRIFCPFYDRPPKRGNITELPLNLCAADPTFFRQQADAFAALHRQNRPAVGIIIGGPNAVSEMDADDMEQTLRRIFALTEGMERWVTTSRRTPPAVETVIGRLPFDYVLINSRDPYNPVPAFIHLCDRLFVTSDSASMISECASYGTAKVEILMNRQTRSPNKFETLIRGLEERNAVHVFDGTLGTADRKVDLQGILRKAMGV